MSKLRALCGLLLASAFAMLAARADEHVKLNVQTGLWEITVHPQMSGADPTRSAEMDKEMQKLTPEQRQRMMAAMQAMMANVVREHVFRQCMTEEKLSKGFDTGKDSDNCKSKVVSNTSTDFEYRKECASDSGEGHTENAHFHIQNRRSVTGTVDAVASHDGQATKIHETLEGKWIASDCGGIKDSQEVR